jgi:hypothetical protein
MISIVEMLQRIQAEMHPDAVTPKPQFHRQDIEKKKS